MRMKIDSVINYPYGYLFKLSTTAYIIHLHAMSVAVEPHAAPGNVKINDTIRDSINILTLADS